MSKLVIRCWGYRTWVIRISSSWGLTWRPAARGHPAGQLKQGMAGWPWRGTRLVVTCSRPKHLGMFHCFNAMSCSGLVYWVITFICMGLHQQINTFLSYAHIHITEHKSNTLLWISFIVFNWPMNSYLSLFLKVYITKFQVPISIKINIQ